MAENLEHLAYCRMHMLPVWERWSDGNLTARRLLEHGSADAASGAELLSRFMTTAFELGIRGRGPRFMAALAAASACCEAYIGVSAQRFASTCDRAWAADTEARRAQAN